VLTVSTAYGDVPVKLSGEGESEHAKPEFDVCVRLAKQHSVPVRRVLDAALAAISRGAQG
jgi:uncharacterized protein (DUF111 family)